MPSYQAPVKDMQFLLHEVFAIEQTFKNIPHYQGIERELLDSILYEAARINEEVIQPLNQSGDEEGCTFLNGEVKTPKGIKEAYQHYVESGWLSLNAPSEYGGQGLPKMLQVLIDEMLASSNVSFSLYCVLTQGAAHALHLHASENIKKLFLPPLIQGKWGGTMCLTEPHCGTDLSLIKTKAEPQPDGSYLISGTKIFITSGEHDLTENIVHTVLARIPGAPPGIRGISLFVVPKFSVNSDGSLGERNQVFCGAIEHKMGIRASATCVMNFDSAKGYLIGQMHQGMKAMFDMMNLERINIGLEGLSLSEVSYQNALKYAKERLQGRSPEGAKYPEKSADPLLVHPDVRRMLLTMKAYNEGARALLVWTGQQVDISLYSDSESKLKAEQLVAFMTPIIKAFFTDFGFETCNLGLQVLGGHGYVKEWGMEQFVRDARIAQIYEGANGIQALDLVKRKLILDEGKTLHLITDEMQSLIQSMHSIDALRPFKLALEMAVKLWLDLSDTICQQVTNDPNSAGAASVDYLRVSALVILAWMWARMAKVAHSQIESDAFYSSKIKTARFYYQRILPDIESLALKIRSGPSNLMDFAESEF